MATRPAKRLRRSTVILSEDEDASTDSSTLPLRSTNVTDVKTDRKKASSIQSSPTTSPRKTRKIVKQKVDLRSNRSLHNFFGKATEEQRWQRKTESQHKDIEDDLILDDIVDDDSLEDDSQNSVITASRLSVATRSTNFRSSTPSSSQKFARPVPPPNTSSQEPVKREQSVPQDHKPWADRYAPCTVEELAVHKKKVADVQKWVQDAVDGKTHQKMLVLKGPAGSGKSTTISMIADALNIGVTSWRNPSAAEIGSISSIQQFADFLDTGAQFEALSLGQTATQGQDQGMLDATRQLLVVEEFPTMTRSSGILDRLRSILEQYLSRPAKTSHSNFRSSTESNRPLILIISETLLTSSTALSDSFTAHRLLGAGLLSHPLVSVVEFNPVAPTFISKALDLVIKREAKDSGRRRIPGPAVLQSLADVGDIRSAINSLEFLCARGDDSSNWSGTVASRQKNTSKRGTPLTQVEQNTLKLISLRESTLDMFHAAGKIVYNKREDPRVSDSRAEPPPKPPDHLIYLYTPKVSQVDVDALLNETGTDIQTFVSTLHENFVLSCNGDDFVDYLDGCAQHLSDSDILNPETRSVLRNRGALRNNHSYAQSGNSDMLRQDEISFQVASRGLLFWLPFPVNRAVPYGARKQDAFKMFYPASLRLWKPTEEIDDLISFFVHKQPDESAAASFSRSTTGGVASWKSRSLVFGTDDGHDDTPDDLYESPRSLASRDSLIIEVLPYLTKIRTSKGIGTQTLKKITQLRGFNMFDEEMPEDELIVSNRETQPVSSTLRQKVEVAHNILKIQRTQAIKSRSGNSHGVKALGDGIGPVVSNDEKFYISDDDISDE